MFSAKYKVSEDAVRAVPAPEFTDRWHPISHAQVLDVVEQAVALADVKIIKKQFGMTNEKNRMFGVLDLQIGEGSKDLTMSVGVRNSIDKSLAAAICLGTRVFVCDNLSFSGEKVLTKKHTDDIETLLPSMVAQTFQEFLNAFKMDDSKVFDTWKNIEISKEKATDFIVHLCQRSALPMRGILEVRHEYLHPRHPEFEPRTVWSLFNAVTQYGKKHQQQNPFSASTESIKQFNLFKTEWAVAA